MKKLSIIIPCYNEKATIEALLRKVLAAQANLEKEIIIVNDGSNDGTAEILQSLREPHGFRLIHHAKNLGRGASLVSALKDATGDIIILQDGDLEYDPADYPRLIGPIMEGRADIVYGSRFNGRERWQGYRANYFFNKALLITTRLITKLPITDALTGYRAFRSNLIKPLTLRENRFPSDIELLFRVVAENRHRFIEIPARYMPRTYGEGKKIGVSDAFDIIRFVVGHVLRTAIANLNKTAPSSR